MKKFYNLLVLTIFGFGVNAQTVNIINNTGTSGNIVVGGSNYHVSESIYTDSEIGSGNFISAGSAIQKLNFFMNVEGSPNTINSYKIWMKNISSAITTLSTGTYTNAGYTLVFSGTFNATPATLVGVTLSTPFVRTAGSNLEVLIERLDNTLHTGYNFYSSNGNNINPAATTSRRYNSNILPVSGTSSLAASAYRPAIQFVHQFPFDAGIIDIANPTVSCYNSSQSINVEVSNEGLNPIAAGAASVTLNIGGPNTYTGTLNNSAEILPGSSEIITFSGININNAGDNIDSAFVTLAGDGTTYNDTLVSVTTTASVLNTYPIVEDAETSLPVFPYAQLVAGADQLWGLQTGKYANNDQLDSLVPRAPGSTFYIFDSYSGAGSLGYISRLFSNCIELPSPFPPNPDPVTTVSFWMTHDNVFPTSLDSLYLTISTDKGLTWTRIQGFQRYDATYILPDWKNEIVDISAYNGQTVQLGFEGVSEYGNIIGLDDIIIDYSGLAPVSMLSFEAKRNGRVNNLTWTTSQELNTTKFVVERSNDGLNFSPIGNVTAVGNSTTASNYRYIDAAPAKGINYYRLRILDNDNSYKISEIKNVRNLGVAEMAINPNPVQQTMNIAVDAEASEKATVVITDLSGRRMYNSNVNVETGTNNFVIPVNNLSKGTYIVMIHLGNETLIKKITKL